ncbi:MAG: C45 family autoproteolytic acyltransferase/hydrolase [Acidobacteriaceae bacterium]
MSIKIPQHSNAPLLVRASGTHREIGQQIGQACSEQVRHSLENARDLVEKAYDELQLTWEGAQIQSRKYLPFAQERYPQYVDELMGIAEGAGVPFDDVMVLNAMEAVTTDALHLTKCTTMAVSDDYTTDGNVLIAHNEDWLPQDEQDVYVVHAAPNDEPPFLAMTYGGLLPNIGFNAAGIAQCCDSVRPNDSRIGIPRVIVSRAVLGASTPNEAIHHMLVPHRAAGYNHLLAHESGELYNVEVSAQHFALLYAENGRLVHTNNYLDYNMRLVEDEPDELIDSRVRYFRAQRLLERTSMHSIKSLQSIQRDHVNFPDSICNHVKENTSPLLDKKTVCAIIIDLTSRVMHMAWGNPCQNPYFTYHLEC